MQRRKQARHAPTPPITQTAGPASRTVELEELKAWCAKHGIGPEEIDSEELQTWCVKHNFDPTTARRTIEFAARHGGRFYCAGCAHCTRREVATSTDDDMRAVWDARMTPLEGLPSIADAKLKPALARLNRDLDTLRRAVELASRVCETQRIRSAQEMLPHVAADPAALRRALDDIQRQRREHRRNERKASVRRLFDLEIKRTDRGIALHVERVGSAGVIGTVVSNPSSITLRALRAYPPIDRDWCEHPLQAPGERDPSAVPDQRDEDRPVSLWSALRLDPPKVPTLQEIGALKARAQLRRDEHDRFVATVDSLDPNSAERDAHRALELRYLAVRGCREWLEVRRQAAANSRDDVRNRRERLAILAKHLKVEVPGRWTIADLARLILASTDDWTPPPCPVFVAGFRNMEAHPRRRERALAEFVRKDLDRAGWHAHGTRRKRSR